MKFRFSVLVLPVLLQAEVARAFPNCAHSQSWQCQHQQGGTSQTVQTGGGIGTVGTNTGGGTGGLGTIPDPHPQTVISNSNPGGTGTGTTGGTGGQQLPLKPIKDGGNKVVGGVIPDPHPQTVISNSNPGGTGTGTTGGTGGQQLPLKPIKDGGNKVVGTGGQPPLVPVLQPYQVPNQVPQAVPQKQPQLVPQLVPQMVSQLPQQQVPVIPGGQLPQKPNVVTNNLIPSGTGSGGRPPKISTNFVPGGGPRHQGHNVTGQSHPPVRVGTHNTGGSANLGGGTSAGNSGGGSHFVQTTHQTVDFSALHSGDVTYIDEVVEPGIQNKSTKIYRSNDAKEDEFKDSIPMDNTGFHLRVLGIKEPHF